MGYDLHITRKTFWADPDGPHITTEKWLAFIAPDPQLERDHSAGNCEGNEGQSARRRRGILPQRKPRRCVLRGLTLGEYRADWAGKVPLSVYDGFGRRVLETDEKNVTTAFRCEVGGWLAG
jgi:hypothetical protein